MIESIRKCLTFFKSKPLNQHDLKTTLQEAFRKKESNFCEKEASLTKTINYTDLSFFIASFLGL